MLETRPPAVLDVGEMDLAIVRKLAVMWIDMESGTPVTAPDPTLGTADEFRHAVFAAEVLMDLGELAPGRFTFVSPLGAEEIAQEPFGVRGHVEVDGRRVTIEVTPDHLKLLRAANTMFLDDGGHQIGIGIDAKRPYGDMTDFSVDMGRILGIAPEDGDEFTEAQQDRFDELHEDMQPVLQVFLMRAQLAPGRFAQDERRSDGHLWRRLTTRQ
jgi:hypothetical protein